MGAYKLPGGTLANRLTAILRVQNFDEERVGTMKMKVIGVIALTREVAQHFGHAIVGVANAEAPHIFHRRAEFDVIEACFTAEQPYTQLEIPRITALCTQKFFKQSRI